MIYATLCSKYERQRGLMQSDEEIKEYANIFVRAAASSRPVTAIKWAWEQIRVVEGWSCQKRRIAT